MSALAYFLGFLAMVVASVLCGAYVEGLGVAMLCAVLISFGLVGMTAQIAEALDDE